MRHPVIKTTEKGGAVVTAQLLLDTIIDALYHAYANDDLESNCCSYLIGAMNQMTRTGLTELSEGKPNRGSTPDTKTPPPFFSQWMKPDAPPQV